MNSTHTFVVILAGGGGTRLWPHSRRSRPKQFLPMLPGGETLIGATIRRTQTAVPLSRTLVVTTAAQVPELRRCVPDLPVDNILVEPIGRNTAPCIGLAALAVARRDPDGVMAVLPSDHFISDEAAFARTLAAALSVASAGHIVTLGIRPTHAETGYGYIRLRPEVPGEPARLVDAFVEKPDAARAAAYVAAGSYLWNSGTFFFPARRILDELRSHLPALGAILDELYEHPERTAARYPEAPAISIDYAVMERLGAEQAGEAAAIRVLPGDFGWNDVGSFAAISALHPADAARNYVVSRHTPAGAEPEPPHPAPILVGSSENLVWNSGHLLIAALGVRDLVIAATDDVVLVMPRERAQDVREIVAHLEATGLGKHL